MARLKGRSKYPLAMIMLIHRDAVVTCASSPTESVAQGFALLVIRFYVSLRHHSKMSAPRAGALDWTLVQMG